MKRLSILFLAIILSGGLIYVSVTRAYQGAYQNEYDAAARTLRMERRAVEEELNQVNQDLKKVILGKGCVAFVFTELSDDIYTEVLPLMIKYGYQGTMAFSPKQLPGEDACMSQEHFNKLLSCGWQTGIYWAGQTDLATYSETISGKLEEIGVDMPRALYTAYGDYRAFKDEAIRNAGYEIVVHHGEAGELVARSDEDAQVQADLFKIGAIAWNISSIKDMLEDLISYGGAMVIEVDFSQRYSRFAAEQFENMLIFLHEHEESLYVTDLQGTKENLSMANKNEYLLARKAYLLSELERYDKEISAIYRLTIGTIGAADGADGVGDGD